MNACNVEFTQISVTSQTSKMWSSVLLKRRRWSGCMRVVYWTGFLWQVRRKHHTSTERHTRCISCRRPLELRCQPVRVMKHHVTLTSLNIVFFS